MRGNKDEPANPIKYTLIGAPGTYCAYEGETKYEAMYKTVLAGLCGNSRFDKVNFMLTPDIAKEITDKAFEILDDID